MHDDDFAKVLCAYHFDHQEVIDARVVPGMVVLKLQAQARLGLDSYALDPEKMSRTIMPIGLLKWNEQKPFGRRLVPDARQVMTRFALHIDSRFETCFVSLLHQHGHWTAHAAKQRVHCEVRKR